MELSEHVDKAVEEALDYAKDLARGDQPAGGANINSNKLETLITQAGAARDFRRQMQAQAQATRDAEANLERAEAQIAKLKTEIEQAKLREAMHTGMCSAFQTSLFTLAQGFASGGSGK